jgi:hypothetical protein
MAIIVSCSSSSAFLLLQRNWRLRVIVERNGRFIADYHVNLGVDFLIRASLIFSIALGAAAAPVVLGGLAATSPGLLGDGLELLLTEGPVAVVVVAADY